MRKTTAAVLFVLLMLASSMRADDTTSDAAPVHAIADHTLHVATTRGQGDLPLYASVNGGSVDLTAPHPEVTRALLVFHGKLRNADVYNASGLKAVRAAGAAGKTTLLITPQFLAQVDIDAFHLPAAMLRWSTNGWMGGDDALNARVSSFDAIDAILAMFADRGHFPNLRNVVLAGHSGGGQIVQRYAVVGREPDLLLDRGIHVRFVVANPSSYIYFSPLRPVLDAQNTFRFALPRKSCYGHYDLWKFGINDPPPYVGRADFAQLEQRYVHRDVRYLLGTEDTDPNHPALDKTCPAEDEGPYRLYRGKAYFSYLEQRHPELTQPGATQQLWLIPGVGHDGDLMLTSVCGLAAIFDVNACTTRVLTPRP